MDRSTNVSILLLSILVLWECYTSSPSLDHIFPYIRVSNSYSDVYISLSEVMAMFLAPIVVILCYCLFWKIANGCVSLIENLALLSCACVLCSGSGLHIACVTAETNIRDLGLTAVESLSALLDFIHEYWSHNSMLFGFFGMMLFITWKETVYVSIANSDKKDNDDAHENAHENTTERGGYNKSSLKQRKLQNSRSDSEPSHNSVNPINRPWQLGLLYGLYNNVVIQWILPLQAGLFLSVFSRRTSTEIITTCFYAGILLIMTLARSKYSLMRVFRSSELTVLSVMIKIASIGLLTLCIEMLGVANLN